MIMMTMTGVMTMRTTTTIREMTMMLMAGERDQKQKRR